MIGVGGCVASQEGDGITKSCAVRRRRVRPADAASICPQMIDDGESAIVHPWSTSRFLQIEKFDQSARTAGPRDRRRSSRVMEGCSKYCSFCVVPYTRGEEISRPFDDVIAEVAAARRAGRSRGQSAGAKRQCLSRSDARRHGRGSRHADLLRCGNRRKSGAYASRPRIPSSSPTASCRPTPRCRNWPSYLHLPVQHGSDRILALDEAWPHGAGVQAEDPQTETGAARHIAVVGFHRRFPRRDGQGLRGDDESHRRRRFRPVVQLHLQRAARARPLRASPTTRRSRSRKQRLQLLAGDASTSRPGRSSAGPWWVRRSACSSKRLSKKSSNQVRRAHGKQSLGKLRRRTRRCIGRFVDVVITEALPNSLRGRRSRTTRLRLEAKRDPRTSKSPRIAVVCSKPLIRGLEAPVLNAVQISRDVVLEPADNNPVWPIFVASSMNTCGKSNAASMSKSQAAATTFA